MRIGIDGRPLQEKYGGVKEYTLNLLHALFSLDQKNEYHIFYNSFGQIDAPDFKKYPNVTIHQFHWPNKLLNLSMRLFNYPKLDKLIFQNYHLPPTTYHLDLFFLPNLNFIALSLKCKLIATVHDLSFHYFPEFYSLKQQLRHKAIDYKRLLSQPTKIITVSEHTKNDLIETFDIATEKIEVVYPCLSNPPQSPFLKGGGRGSLPFPPEADQPLEDKKGEPERDFILYLGTLEPRKNIESIIEAYKILKKKNSNLPKLIIAGPKGWRYKSIFKIIDSSIKNDVVFSSQVSEEEKIALYQSAKLFIFPSFYEGFGLPPLEAASFGVPIIASTVSSLPEVLGDAAFYVNPWNVAELAEAMDFLLHNEEMRAKLSQAGKQQAAKFQNQESAAKLLRIFEEVATIKTL